MSVVARVSRPAVTLWTALAVCGVVWAMAMLVRGAPLAPDELEFFRATRWVAEGKVPFRDFWEHHTPLQWIVFAPFARMLARGPGADALIALRVLQLALWAATFVVLARLPTPGRGFFLPALALLLASPTFVRRALEYRVDVVGNLLVLTALAVVATRGSRRRYALFGALMAAAVLANMRAVPLALAAAGMLLFRMPGERRWRWNAEALWMTTGVAAVAAAFLGWLHGTGAWPSFARAMFEYNVVSGRLLAVRTFADAILAPLWTLDAAGIAFWILGIAGVAGAVRSFRSPGIEQVLAILAVVSVAAVAAMQVQYDYHLQGTWLLLVPLVAGVVQRLAVRWQATIAGIAVVSLAVFMLQVWPSYGAEVRYQDRVMRAVDSVTSNDERVLDGAGYALRREPAYRYWFLTTGVRMMAQQGLIERYDLRDLRRDPPAAIVFDYRLALYVRQDPRLAQYVAHHYVPLYRNLWVPGLMAVTPAGRSHIVWTAPRSGVYDVVASEVLTRHPWVRDPIGYAQISGPSAAQLAIPLRRLPPLPPGAVRWHRPGGIAAENPSSVVVEKGQTVEVTVEHERAAGILFVPRGTELMCVGPAERFVF